MRTWTREDRLRQSLWIKEKKPWLLSTGPKTRAGKAISKMNACKHGMRTAEVRSIEQSLAKYKKTLANVIMPHFQGL